jgi:hypothetical protein
MKWNNICPTKKRAASWNCLQSKGGEGPGPPYSKEKSPLEPSRDGENTMKIVGESIPDVMKEDQRTTE